MAIPRLRAAGRRRRQICRRQSPPDPIRAAECRRASVRRSETISVRLPSTPATSGKACEPRGERRVQAAGDAFGHARANDDDVDVSRLVGIGRRAGERPGDVEQGGRRRDGGGQAGGRQQRPRLAARADSSTMTSTNSMHSRSNLRVQGGISDTRQRVFPLCPANGRRAPSRATSRAPTDGSGRDRGR